MSAKILLLDIETAPNKVYTWGLWNQNIGLSQIIQEGYLLCWGAKWLGKRGVMTDALPNYKKWFKEHPTNDLKVVSIH